jgi:hypothetical protein
MGHERQFGAADQEQREQMEQRAFDALVANNPIAHRALGMIRFRASDPPSVRKRMLEEAIARESADYVATLSTEHKPRK